MEWINLEQENNFTKNKKQIIKNLVTVDLSYMIYCESTVYTGYLHTWGSCRIPPYTCYSSDHQRSGDNHTVHSTAHRSLHTIRTCHSYRLKHNRDTRCTNSIKQPKMLNVIHVIQSNIPESHDVSIYSNCTSALFLQQVLYFLAAYLQAQSG